MTLERGSRTLVENYLEIACGKDRMARATRAGVGTLSAGLPA
ncbi:hypothetical protein [Streptomyces spiramyceticus]|nr:hypothetical protein [Streptomyces spiramyceticus]